MEKFHNKLKEMKKYFHYISSKNFRKENFFPLTS